MKSTSAKTDILLKCLYCKEDNPLAAQYCHMCGHIIDLSAYEGAILSKNKVPHKIRIRVAKETCKEAVMLRCVRDPAVSVFNALKQNPNLTPRLKSMIQKRDTPIPVKSYSTPTPPPTPPTQNNDKGNDIGCFGVLVVLAIIVGTVILIINL